MAQVDSVRLAPVAIGGRRDTVTASVAASDLAPGLTTDPERVEATVPLEAGLTGGSRSTSFLQGTRVPHREPAEGHPGVSGPRRSLSSDALESLAATWTMPVSPRIGQRVALKRTGRLPEGVKTRFEPDSVTLARAL